MALLIFDRNLIPMPFPVITRILSISVSQTCGSLILLRGNLGKSGPKTWRRKKFSIWVKENFRSSLGRRCCKFRSPIIVFGRHWRSDDREFRTLISETDFCIRNWNVFNINNFPKMTKKTCLYVWFWILLLFASCQLNFFHIHVTGLKFNKDFFEYRKYFIRQSGDRNWIFISHIWMKFNRMWRPLALTQC